jgi:hypothetical protein
MVWATAKKKSENSCGSVKINAQWPVGRCAFIYLPGVAAIWREKATFRPINRLICAESLEIN